MKKLIVLSVACLFASVSFSQKIKLLEGDPSLLKGEDVMGVEYTYENLKIGKITEEEYIAKQKEERDAKEPGSGDKWVEAWNNDRPTRYEPKFEELFNKYAESIDLFIDNTKDDTKYKMLINTYFIEPGFNVGVSSRPAYVSMIVSFVETANPENVVAKFDIMRARGSAHFDSGLRISEGYALAGKSFARSLRKQIK